MKFAIYPKAMRVLAIVLAALLLTAACGQGPSGAGQNETAAAATEVPAQPVAEATAEPTAKPTPEPTPESAEPLPEGAVEVGTVDELLAALAPNATVVLKEGEYDLSTASDYGREDLRGYYRWELVLGGAQLNISGLKGLRLVGRGQASIVTRPRYAEVLSFTDCWDLTLEGLTLGHTQAPEGCIGGVLSLYTCENVSLENCRLYGCGVLGVSAVNCESVTVRESQIDNCSSGAVYAASCRDMRLEDCRISDCGISTEGAGGSLFFLDRCRGFALVNSEITGNRAQELMLSSWSDLVALMGCRVEQNRFLNAVFELQGRGVTVDKCAFRLRGSERYYSQTSGAFALDLEGRKLTKAELDQMEQGRAEYAGPAEQTVEQPERTELPDGRFEVHAATVDQLLLAIAPNTTILLDAGVYDLSSALDYGGPGGDWYCWDNDVDGFTLRLLDVRGLSIAGAGPGETILMAEPRYAAVLRFQNCEDVSLRSLTAGHSEDPGFCTGNVLDFDGCSCVSIEDCGLYGCGVLGIWAFNCTGLTVKNTEIYQCASGAADLVGCEEVSFEGCSIHDCDERQNYITLVSTDATWDGQLLSDGTYEFLERAYLGEVRFD